MRLLYLDSERNQKECMELILREQGFESLLDMFELLEKVGDGASAEVMLVQHKLTGEKFAMKIIQACSEGVDVQVNREIGIQTRCRSCPYIVRFKD